MKAFDVVNFLLIKIQVLDMVLVEKSEIEEFVDEASDILGDRVEEVLLFGSYAREDHVPGSDVDLLFLVSSVKSSDREELSKLAGEYFLEKEVVFSPKIVEKEKFDKRRKESSGFYSEVADQGVKI